jgi:homopolymeric O-antigen transport system ATP-binding protein
MSDAILKVSDVGKSYRNFTSHWRRVQGWLNGAPSHFTDHWVLRNISFSVASGESIGILGRNGAGKSTLLKIIAGTLTPTEGAVSLRGRINAILELGMGFNTEFTARQNVLHTCGMLGYGREEIENALPTIEQFAEIGEYFDQPLRTFSSGMQMRVAFAAATAFRPDILIIDEALSVGDISFQAKCFERITALRETGTTLLYVSHAVGDVVKHCERALFIRDGTLAMDGSAREVSNVYLDYMFGKGSKDVVAEADAQRGKPAPFEKGRVERFHSRPFYRKEEYRWGAGGAKISDYHIEAAADLFPPTIKTHQVVRVSFKVDFWRDVECPVYGLLIKTIEGIFLYGTNSRLIGLPSRPDPVKAGESHIAAFELPVMLNTGTYLVSIGISDEQSDGELVPLDRRYDSIFLTVDNPQPGPGMLDLNARFKLALAEGFK